MSILSIIAYSDMPKSETARGHERSTAVLDRFVRIGYVDYNTCTVHHASISYSMTLPAMLLSVQ